MRKITDAQIASGIEALRAAGRSIHWRSLQAWLISQHGSAGRTDRLRSACRRAQEPKPQLVALQWEARVAELERLRFEAEQARDRALARAVRSEEREIAHQDRWAAEIHRLRESVEQLKEERSRRQSLEQQLARLQRELQSAYGRLTRYEG